jgi:hypothetical protein
MTELPFEKRITLGFKLMAGYHRGEISRDATEKLASDESIPWGSTGLERDINRMMEVVMQDDLFKFSESWRISIMDQTSDAVAINFLLVLLKDWERKGKPVAPGAASTRLFLKNARILLDRSVYEYITKQWRGSSDSRIAGNLSALGTQNPLLERIPDERWTSLIQEVVDRGSIEGRSYLLSTDRSIRLLLLYMYVVAEVDGPTEPNAGYDLDHIIPQSAFEAHGDLAIEPFKNHVTNLALLPHRQNITKSDRPLREINEPWLRRQVLKYEGITETDYPRYSAVDQFDALRAFRGPLIVEALTTTRAGRLG